SSLILHPSSFIPHPSSLIPFVYLGYNTNGLAHHDLLDAVDLLADIGYRGVAITIDHGALSPRDPHWQRQLERLWERLQRYQMRSVIETGARYLLDPRAKHQPTLLTADAEQRRRRVDLLLHALHIADKLGSKCVSLWSGAPSDAAPPDVAMQRLADALVPVVEQATAVGIPLAFEPEPGMFIDTMARYDELVTQLDSPALRLTLDIGHLHCQGETPIAGQIRRWGPRLVNVHLEDMRAGVHEHLMFGEGEIDFPPIFAALGQIEYAHGVFVELSRHSHMGPEAAAKAFDFLRSYFPPPAEPA
ncbi:MAG: sugar phosphate isomerase/epimerase family protein, partial [Pirellulales bacterium]